MAPIDVICDWACENRAYLHTNLGLLLKLNSQYLFKHESYDNKNFLPYLHINT